MKGLLDGVRVIEFAARGGGPIGGVVLGDFGADVIKIENPDGGDPVRDPNRWLPGGVRAVPPGGHGVAFELSDRNKRGITIDLSKEKGREIAYRLIEKSDAFLTNYEPHRLKRLSMDYETLSKINPRLVYAAASSFGNKGPDKDKQAFDWMALARSGMMMAVSEPDGAPGQIVGTIADCMGGTFLGFAVICGLLARERLGVGQEVNSALFGAMLWAQYAHISLYLMDGRTLPARQDRIHTNPTSNNYKCKDGKWLNIMVREWPAFCQVIGIGHLEKDSRFDNPEKRQKNASELVKILDDIFSKKTRDEWIAYIKEKNAPIQYEIVNTIPDLPNDPQLIANNYIVEHEHPGLGKIKYMQFPFNFSKTPVDATRLPAPQLGEHNNDVLQEFGYNLEEIAQFKKDKII
jgi:crotonobetainyl-CoA:carnitine CoA-transferase CaiB-like acyl-CoA transferase